MIVRGASGRIHGVPTDVSLQLHLDGTVFLEVISGSGVDEVFWSSTFQDADELWSFLADDLELRALVGEAWTDPDEDADPAPEIG